jgi:hypothetical protein
MSDANVSHLGQVQGAGALDALWLKVFAGEVLTAFEIMVKLRGKVRTRSIKGAKQATFPATFRTTARIHTPGTEILGNIVQANEQVISLDDLVITDTFVAQIEELKNYYDVRAAYANEHGREQALYYDRVIANSLVVSARNTTELFVGDGAGGLVIDQPNVSASADFTSSGSDLISGINLAKQTLDQKAVPVETMPVYCVLKPAQWYLIANSDHNINRLYNGNNDQSSINRQSLKTVSDIEIIKSIAPLFGYNVSVYNASTNATGIVSSADPTVIGTTSPAAALLPFGAALPGNYPVKYQSDQTKTVGVVWCEPAVAMLELLGITMETVWDTRRQGTLMLAKQALGAGSLRSKCAVELQRH